jgi:hypothetical protein
MEDGELIEYLDVPWISKEEHLELIERMGLVINRDEDPG